MPLDTKISRLDRHSDPKLTPAPLRLLTQSSTTPSFLQSSLKSSFGRTSSSLGRTLPSTSPNYFPVKLRSPLSNATSFDLTDSSIFRPTPANMSSPSQDQVTADGHLQTQPSTQDAPAELSAAVDELLDGLTTKFDAVSTEIFAKMDEMSRRLDSLEASILSQTGNDTNQPN